MLSPVTPAFETRLRAVLPDAAFRDPQGGYLVEPRGLYAAQAGLVVAPANTAEVSVVMQVAFAASVPVIPYGGGTGLVGGQVAPDGPTPLILSLERMTQIREVFPSENVMVAEAGAILTTVQDAAENVDRVFALSLASEGSARIGGLLSTNAGGVNVLRYGNARDQVLGLEVVRPDGSIWNGLSRLRKDNTGYDLRHLMIGAEGTLGIITAAALKLQPRPAAYGSAFFVVPSPQAALDLLHHARQTVGDTVSAFELIGKKGLEFLSQTLPDVRQPFDDQPEWMVLIELGVSVGQDPDALLSALFESAGDLVLDGTIAQSLTQRAAFWSVRESIPLANRKIGSISSHDISLPLSLIPEFIAQAPARIAEIGDFQINCFGHLGDGNLHYNVFPLTGHTRADHTHQRSAIKKTVHDMAHQFGGSVSAEHGIGRLKVDDLKTYGDPEKLAMMRAIKTALDPKGIMNPGAVLRLL